jgi:hypothetical protein
VRIRLETSVRRDSPVSATNRGRVGRAPGSLLGSMGDGRSCCRDRLHTTGAKDDSFDWGKKHPGVPVPRDDGDAARKFLTPAGATVIRRPFTERAKTAAGAEAGGTLEFPRVLAACGPGSPLKCGPAALGRVFAHRNALRTGPLRLLQQTATPGSRLGRGSCSWASWC